ncbi:YiiX/YebB-like N1pC/P60 family cysteine hydrolase [Halobacteriovorax sp. HLS]|uniref:YiiX/YebB-like N1pC/P60 family cysteine hydrolase n=1 Tax=Halobacteriovorax sp. HLS TaxID=2234000 RepID=UPI000FD9FDD2|nr:YiiX/YebB-like N1pC/P60 family cysteine hydrolase [Halobacteriovorax sp. HLS]
MKRLLLTISFVLSINALSAMPKLKVGDIILLDLDCYSCQVIEDETNSRFSHSGVVISDGRELYVAQSLSNVHHLKVNDFLRMTKKFIVKRPVVNIDRFKKYHWQVYKRNYYQLPFDYLYLWDDESLYCSEFIYKFMNALIDFKNFEVAPMDFSNNWNYWEDHFGTTPPQDMPGISPEDFNKSKDFKLIYDSVK